MYEELGDGASLAPAALIGPAPLAVLEGMTGDLPPCQEAATQSLGRISGLLDSLSVEIPAYHRLHDILSCPTESESIANDAALECMENSLEDIMAALTGLQACARKTPDHRERDRAHPTPWAG